MEDAKNVQALGKSHIGLRREQNQDRFLIKELAPGRTLLAVADGVGGVAGGEVAAQMAVDKMAALASDGRPEGAGLRGQVKDACRAIMAKAEAAPGLSSMATTLTVALWDQGRVHWAHSGDCRLYLLRNGSMRQITRDHTMAAFMVQEGMLSVQEAQEHPGRHILFECLGCGECEPDVGSFAAGAGDLLLLCSDGLYDMVPDDQIARVLAWPRPLDRRLEELLAAALEAGGRDNVTIVAAQLED